MGRDYPLALLPGPLYNPVSKYTLGVLDEGDD
jgi:hypothetical protein